MIDDGIPRGGDGRKPIPSTIGYLAGLKGRLLGSWPIGAGTILESARGMVVIVAELSCRVGEFLYRFQKHR